MTKHAAGLIVDPFTADFSHPLDELPYRATVFCGFDHNNTPVYWVAGQDGTKYGAERALRNALKQHGGCCFYCGLEAVELDHVIPKSRGGATTMANLVVSCRNCNVEKSNKSIATFNPPAAYRWYIALAGQLNDKLIRLQLATINPLARLQPSPGAAAGP